MPEVPCNCKMFLLKNNSLGIIFFNPCAFAHVCSCGIHRLCLQSFLNYSQPREDQNLVFLEKTICLVSANWERFVILPVRGGHRVLYPQVSVYRVSPRVLTRRWDLRALQPCCGCPGWVIWGTAASLLRFYR